MRQRSSFVWTPMIIYWLKDTYESKSSIRLVRDAGLAHSQRNNPFWNFNLTMEVNYTPAQSADVSLCSDI